MNKRVFNFLALILALVLCLAMVVPAMAIEASDADTGKTSVKVYKNLIIDANTNVPDVTFEYTLASRPNNPDASTATVTYYAGITTGLTTSYNVRFASSETPTPGSPGNTGDAEHKYLKKEFEIEFKNVNFTEPGIYRYILTEQTQSGYSAEVYTYYIDVFVEYVRDTGSDGVFDLTIGNFVIYKDGNSAPEKVNDVVYNNRYPTNTLDISKTVAGNQGSRNEFFPFSIAFTAGSVPAGDYTISGQNGNNDAEHPTYKKITVAADGTVTPGTIYLKHDQKIQIIGLPSTAGYTIKETNSGDYTVSTVKTEGSTVTNGTSATVTGTLGDATTVAYTNTRTGTIPTGVLLTIAPFAGLMIVGLVGVVIVLKKKRNR